jgi:hypothetical protein
LHMAGFERERETPLEFAQHQVDPALNTNFEAFMRMYLRLKYTNGQARPEDTETLNSFAKNLGPAIRKKNGFLTAIAQYFNLFRANRFFQNPVVNTEENNIEPNLNP